MPIIGRTARECFQDFREPMARLISATLTVADPLLVLQRDDAPFAVMAFLQGLPVAIPLETRFGRIHFFMWQALEAVHEKRSRFRLSTRGYSYRIQDGPGSGARAWLRWEYDAKLLAKAQDYCRHHLHVETNLPIGAGNLDLDKTHLPTGWVTIEEMIRFLIRELGVQPPCGSRWPAVLADSERAFFEDFTSKRYTMPP